MNGFISVIIPFKGDKEELHALLCEIENVFSNGKLKNNYELIVIDDDSNYSAEEIKNINCSFDLIKLDKGYGASYCRNLGAEKAKGDYFLFLDADISINTDFDEKLSAYIDSNIDFDVLTSIYTPKYKENDFLSLYKNIYLSYHLSQFQNPVNFLVGAVCLFKRESFIKFDINTSHVEDTELAQRLIQKNKKIHFAKDLCVEHKKKYNLWRFIENNFRVPFKFCKPFLMYKRKDPASFSHASFLQLLSISLVGLSLIGLFIRFELVLYILLLFFLINIKYYVYILKNSNLFFLILSMITHYIDSMIMGLGILSGLIWYGISGTCLKKINANA